MGKILGPKKLSSKISERDADADIPLLAVRALKRASRRARKAGYPQVVIRDGQLVRIAGNEVTVLKPMPMRKRAVDVVSTNTL